jgi:hypothetical protein
MILVNTFFKIITGKYKERPEIYFKKPVESDNDKMKRFMKPVLPLQWKLRRLK